MARSQSRNGKRQGKRNGNSALPVLSDTRQQVPCLTCALCCTYIAVEIDEPDTVRGATEILWYLYHENTSIYVEDDEWLLQFEPRCRNLGDDHKCSIYEQRPQVCREFDEKACEVNADEVGQTFISPQQFLDYLKQHHKRIHTLVSKKYLPGEEHLQRVPSGKRKLARFDQRYKAMRTLGAR